MADSHVQNLDGLSDCILQLGLDTDSKSVISSFEGSLELKVLLQV
jgi:hypothetical protein